VENVKGDGEMENDGEPWACDEEYYDEEEEEKAFNEEMKRQGEFDQEYFDE